MAKFGGVFSPDKFWTDETYLNYRGTNSGKTFRVLISDIETISIAPVDRLKSSLKVIGKGTTLAETVLYTNIANKAQDFISSQLGN